MDEFLDYWCKKWPFATRDVKVLEKSAHFRGCRDAWFAARQNNAEGEKTPTNSRMVAALEDIRLVIRGRGDSVTKVLKVGDILSRLNA